jgi:hypothetical protein
MACPPYPRLRSVLMTLTPLNRAVELPWETALDCDG